MAFTRKFLTALGIEADKVDEIMTAHVEVTDALKEQRDRYKADAEALPGVQKELDELKKTVGEDGKNPYEVKYNTIKEEYENYKKEQEAKATANAKREAYRKLLKEAGVSEKRLDAVLKVTDLGSVELDKDGGVKDAKKLTDGIKAEWSDFIVTSKRHGAKVDKPEGESGGGAMSRKEIYAKDDKGRYKLDATARQQALANLREAGEE